MYTLVRRSNKRAEAWMATPTWSEPVGRQQVPKWATWWDANRKDLRVVCSREEAFANP